MTVIRFLEASDVVDRLAKHRIQLTEKAWRLYVAQRFAPQPLRLRNRIWWRQCDVDEWARQVGQQQHLLEVRLPSSPAIEQRSQCEQAIRLMSSLLVRWRCQAVTV